MKSREILKHPLTQVAVMTGAALVHTAWKDHRLKTHRSIEMKPGLEFAVDVAGAPFTDTTRWAAVHRIHHATPDANLLPAIEYADAIAWLNQHPEVQGFTVPDTVRGIDPAAEVMTHDEVLAVGALGKELADGLYVPQQDYTPEELERILYGDAPRYLYEAPHADKKAVPNIDGFNASLYDIRYILRDPHSPALHPDGMRGIAIHNMPLYEDVVAFYEKNPQYMPADLEFSERERKTEANKGKIRLGLIAVNMAWRMVADRPRTGREVAGSAAKGATITGIGTLGLIAGGNIVNSLGHGGKENFATAQFAKDFWRGRVRVKDNGTYTTDNALLSPPTLGEVGGQYEHHEDPSLIAYTHETGLKKFLVDPFGTTTEFMARHNIGMRVGPGFEGPRPDMPSDAVLKQEEIRRRYIQQESREER